MALKALIVSLLALFIYRAVALDFSQSYWIWKDNTEVVPAYAVGDFRYDLTVCPGGPYPVSAEIIITGDNNYTLWVNGNAVGQGNEWTISQEYCVALNPYYNVFAAEIVNALPDGPVNPAALLAAIEIFYSDGSTKTILVYCYTLSLANSQWFWTNEISGPGGVAPVGNRTFRQDIVVPGNVPATGGTIIISADNAYTLYINGQQIGTYADWTVAQRYTFTLGSPTQNIVVAVNAENTGGPAGVIAVLELNVGVRSCSGYSVYVTDSSWKYNLGVPAGFQSPSYNDGGWPNAVEEGLYGVAPWGNIPTQ
ncbi:hypothetical protein F5887DRAFT_1165092 [Amanita rubescens]|nr:hypothetical protein F5887DRAFT_1165092 [Amanita rubescens]